MIAMSSKNCGLKTTAARMGGLTRLMRSADKRDLLKEDSCRGHIQPTGGRDKKLINSVGKLTAEWSPSSESSRWGRQLEDRKQRSRQGQR